MTTARDLETIASGWQRSDLLHVWTEIKAGRAIPGWDPGKALEYLVVRAFHLEQPGDIRWPYMVSSPYGQGVEEQIDGTVYVHGMPFLIETKDQGKSVTIDALARLRFRLESRPPGVMGVLFSASDFSQQVELAARFAVPLNVLLWSARDLEQALASGTMVASLGEKYRYAVEWRLAYYPLTTGVESL